jgi:DNA-binding helix-hairpin-helix protein with protein kinase domain
MNVTLANGQTLDCRDEIFGSGADGEMHLSNDGKLLVKLYHQPEPWRRTSLEAILDRFNAVKGEAYWEQLLCWPTSIVSAPRLGIVIPRAAQGMKKMACFIVPKWLKYHPEDTGNFNARVAATIKLSRAVRRLHFKGLCHSDLSENNIFMNSTDGRAYVIDIDGLVVPDLPFARAVVSGSIGVMAPEIEMGKVQSPSVLTERHTLGVLIYELFFLRHPLLGLKVNDRDPDRNQTLQLGEKALFVEHPTDHSNPPRPPDYRWLPVPISRNLVGPAVNKLFDRTFVEGLHNPSRRPLPSEWEGELVHLADTLVPCLNSKCPMKSFPLPDAASGRASVKCPWCGTPFRGFQLPVLRWLNETPNQPGVFRPDGTRKVAWPDVTLHEWHIMPKRLPGPGVDDKAYAIFRKWDDPTTGTHWALVNQGLSYFEAADPQGGWKTVRRDEAVELKPQRKLRFGLPGTRTARDALVEMLQLE